MRAISSFRTNCPPRVSCSGSSMRRDRRIRAGRRSASRCCAALVLALLFLRACATVYRRLRGPRGHRARRRQARRRCRRMARLADDADRDRDRGAFGARGVRRAALCGRASARRRARSFRSGCSSRQHLARLADRGDAACHFRTELLTRSAIAASATPIQAAAASTAKSISRACRPGANSCASSTAPANATTIAMRTAMRPG